MPLTETIIERIKTSGPITVAQYMELCATHYYGTRDPFGAAGDFTTAPEISQVFGELIGAWIQDKWQHLSASQSILCELGPGRGTLMKDLLRVTRHSGLHECTDVALIETSPILRELQMRTLKHSHRRINWYQSFDAVPPAPLFLVANEFFDALPVHQYVEDVERKVALSGDKLVFTPEGKVTRESSPLSVQMMTQIATRIKRYGGAALIIDYGYISDTYGDSLQAVEHHKYSNPLENPGDADITAHVDFLALERAAKDDAHAYVTIMQQGEFLTMLGAGIRAEQLCRNASPEQKERVLSAIERLVSPQQMGILFKVMMITSDKEMM